jgi:hypothetical protein
VSCPGPTPSAAPSSAVPSPTALRLNGVYQSVGGGPYWHYIRFYPDGTVLTVTSSGTPSDLRAWFHRERPDMSKGRFERRGEHLSFSTVSQEGKVDYDGTGNDQTLRLSSHSHINGHRGEASYRFAEWPRESPAPPPSKRDPSAAPR